MCIRDRLYVYNKGLLCCSFLLLFYYEFYYSFYYKAAENRGKQRITEDNGTFTEYREKAQKRYVSGLLKWLYYIIHENIINTGKSSVWFHSSALIIYLFYCSLRSQQHIFSLLFYHNIRSYVNNRLVSVSAKKDDCFFTAAVLFNFSVTDS